MDDCVEHINDVPEEHDLTWRMGNGPCGRCGEDNWYVFEEDSDGRQGT